VAAGCGTQPLPPPNPLAMRPPGRPVELRDPRTGLRFQAPRNWVKRIGTQRIFGRTIKTRSVHVYRAGEYVFEALAPPSQFDVASRRVLDPLLRSLRFRPLPPS